MDFRNARARQPEIVRSVQKDATYAGNLSEDLSDVLRLTGTRNWIKYNQFCKLIAEVAYHGFASVSNLQTLGEEYTGIIQVDADYKQIPSRLLQLCAIILEFGGDAFFLKMMQKLQRTIEENDAIVPEAKTRLLSGVRILRAAPPYLKAMHKSLFYLRSQKYQLSKRTTGINYVLIRHWLQPEFSLYGYKILGAITFMQVSFSLALSWFESWRDYRRQRYAAKKPAQEFVKRQELQEEAVSTAPQCILCLEPRRHVTATPCGHLFCWSCILEWLDERTECPVCREAVQKSQVIQLRNYA